MEKRAFLAVVLSIVVFYIFSMVMGPDKKQAVPVSPQSTAPAARYLSYSLPLHRLPLPRLCPPRLPLFKKTSR